MTHHTQNLGQIEINRFRHHLRINLNLCIPPYYLHNKEMRQIHSVKYARWRFWINLIIFREVSFDFSRTKMTKNLRLFSDIKVI